MADAFKQYPLNRKFEDGPSNTYYTKQNLNRWKTALESVRLGTGNAEILCLGDSNTAHYPTTYNNSFPNSWPMQLVGLLRAMGYDAHGDVVFSNGNVGVNSFTLPQYDTRVSFGSWAKADTSAIGGSNLNSNGTTTTFSFTPTYAFDRIEVTYATTGGGGSFNVNVDGGASLGTTATASGPSFSRAIFNCTLGTHTINIVPVNTTTVYIHSIKAYKSTGGQIIVSNGGGAGLRAADLLSFNYGVKRWGTMAATATNKYSLVCYMTGTNEKTVNQTPEDFSSDVGRVAGEIMRFSDLVLISPCRDGATNTYTNAQYRDEIALIANSQIPFIDFGAILGDYSTANAAGDMANTTHISTQGAGKLAAKVRDVILGV